MTSESNKKSRSMKKILFACLLLVTWGRPILSYTYDLAICGMFQNEARFLKEWIEFHKLVGVQHFYLYNNRSTDDFEDVVDSYIKSGLVEVIDWDFSNVDLYAQNLAFTDVLKRVMGVAKWVAFLDLDEYLFPCKRKSLVKFLKDYKKFGGLAVNWVMFGTSNIDKIPDNGLMIEYLVKCDPKGNKHIKSIVRPETVIEFFNPHYASYKPGFFQVNADKVQFEGPYSPYICIDKIRINHYWTRDIYHLYNVKLPRAESLHTNLMVLDDDSWYIPRDVGRSLMPTEWTMAVSEYMNVAEDYSIKKYLPQLKKALFFAHK